MAVYVDDMKARADVPNGNRVVRGTWSHMSADTTEELLAMARTIGLNPAWIQKPGTWREHFDVTLTKRALAVKAGAIEVSWREHVLGMRDRRAAKQEAAAAPPGQDG